MTDRTAVRTCADALVCWLRWPALAALVLFTLAVLYRYGPARRQARWQWVSWVSVFAVMLWLAAV
jgi:membrane protein